MLRTAEAMHSFCIRYRNRSPHTQQSRLYHRGPYNLFVPFLAIIDKALPYRQLDRETYSYHYP